MKPFALSIFISLFSFSVFGKNLPILATAQWDPEKLDYDAASAYGSRKQLKDLNLKDVPEWQSLEQIQAAYDLVLNERIFNDLQVPGFLRRITWLYKVDGCFTRSGLAAQKLDRESFPDVSQIYVFSGINRVHNWSYHVAIAMRVADTVYVFDPSLDWSGPLEFSVWLSKFTNSSPTKVYASICHETTWDLNGNCAGMSFDDPDMSSGPLSAMTLTQWRHNFQRRERTQLGAEADAQLGDQPPWRP